MRGGVKTWELAVRTYKKRIFPMQTTPKMGEVTQYTVAEIVSSAAVWMQQFPQPASGRPGAGGDSNPKEETQSSLDPGRKSGRGRTYSAFLVLSILFEVTNNFCRIREWEREKSFFLHGKIRSLFFRFSPRGADSS